MSLEYFGIEIRQFAHSAEIKREIPFCTPKRILEYSGIEIRQFTHSAEIKREIPFCMRKRSETYANYRNIQKIKENIKILHEENKRQDRAIGMLSRFLKIVDTTVRIHTKMLNSLNVV